MFAPRSAAALVVLGVLCALNGCGGKSDDIGGVAKLVKADGVIEKSVGSSDWKVATVGAIFLIGDAARTGDGGARFKLTGRRELAMQSHTVLRFGGKKKELGVELGSIELQGEGSYDLAVGRLRLSKNGKVVLTGGGNAQLSLLLGEAVLTPADTDTDRVLLVGAPMVVSASDIVKPATVDANTNTPDAALRTGDMELTVTGDAAELLAAGETKWRLVPAGTSSINAGASIRTGKGTTAKLVHAGTIVDLATGSRASVGSNREVFMLSGSATTSAEQGTVSTVGVLGGKAVLQGQKGPVAARIDVYPNEARVSVSRGLVDLTSKDGTLLAVNRGDSASVSKTGALRVIESIPTYYDVAFSVGESGQIHDPKGATAVKLLFSDKCAGNGDIEVDKDAGFKTPKVSAGVGSANVMLPGGGWYYRLRCNGKVAATGRFLVVRDSGEQRLPAATPTNAVATDGRQYTISYQSVVPNVSVEWKGASGSNFKLVVASGGKSQSYNSASAKGIIPGKGLKEGQFSFWFEREDGLKSKVSTLNVVFEQNAVQVYIESPVNGKPFGNPVEVRGAALEGWKAFTSEGVPLKLDKQRRFAAQFPAPSGNALAIRLSHPKFGTHYYLRRP